MDIALTQWINNLSGRIPGLDHLVITITDYGIFVLVGATAVLWWMRDRRTDARNACLVAGTSFLISLAFNQILLLFIHRIRPYDAGVSHLLIAPNPDWSFPSDHATAAAAIVASLWFKRFPVVAMIFGCFAVLICLSRVYVGVHYVSDIAGGIVIGIIFAFAVARSYRDNSWYARRIVNIL